jgi:hypothetical protein
MYLPERKSFQVTKGHESAGNFTGKVTIFLRWIAKKEKGEYEQRSGFSYIHPDVTRQICKSFLQRFILQILIVITIALRKTN